MWASRMKPTHCQAVQRIQVIKALVKINKQTIERIASVALRIPFHFLQFSVEDCSKRSEQYQEQTECIMSLQKDFDTSVIFCRHQPSESLLVEKPFSQSGKHFEEPKSCSWPSTSIYCWKICWSRSFSGDSCSMVVRVVCVCGSLSDKTFTRGKRQTAQDEFHQSHHL